MSYILESVIVKYSNIHTGAVTDSNSFTSKHWIHPRWSVPTYNRRYKKIIPHTAAIPGFQTEMATKRQNLRTAALTWYCYIYYGNTILLYYYVFDIYHEVAGFFQIFMIELPRFSDIYHCVAKCVYHGIITFFRHLKWYYYIYLWHYSFFC